MAEEFILQMTDVTKIYPPSNEVIKEMSLSFLPGAKIGIIGYNGAGKSTLLRIMAGIDTDIRGEVRLGKGMTVGMLEQEPNLDESKTVRENVEDGLAVVRDALLRFNEVSNAMADPDADFDALLQEQADLQQVIDHADGWNLDMHIDVAMSALRVPEGDLPVMQLSGGEKRRIALARLLLSAPDLLLLDEPTNHLDHESVLWLEQYLAKYAGTIVAITHDRYFLDNLADWILELDRTKYYPWKGNYTGWLEQKQERMRLEEKTDKDREKTIARELEWIRSSPKARQAKSKARIQNFDELEKQQGAVDLGGTVITIPLTKRLGGEVVEFKDVSKAYGDKLLFENLSFTLPRGGIVGVIGPNGAGKSTMMRLLVGQETPDNGSVKIGETVDLGYVDQGRDNLDPAKTVWEEISGGHDIIEFGKREIPSRAYVGQFNFKGSNQQQRVGDLSGGQRNRVHLAKLIKNGCNLLLLDEPTNDLDVDTLRALEEGISQFPGCAVVISHDRWFLDRLATHILAFEGDSEVVWFEGNYEGYTENLKLRKGPDALEPKAIKYRKLVKG
ncbi:MAG: energy-dependent translational throttle protein EttA [Thermoleophilia bacterium]|nr:energy-dependent translational throttle protein EttA [Thermoleophilia bacterium]